MSIVEEFEGGFLGNVFGIITGSLVAAQLPSRPGNLARFKTDGGNIGAFKFGTNSGTCVWPLAAGEETGWFPTKNINEFVSLCVSGTSNYLYYWIKV
jgi:hypothetical protein